MLVMCVFWATEAIPWGGKRGVQLTELQNDFSKITELQNDFSKITELQNCKNYKLLNKLPKITDYKIKIAQITLLQIGLTPPHIFYNVVIVVYQL